MQQIVVVEFSYLSMLPVELCLITLGYKSNIYHFSDEVQPPNKKPRILPGEEIDEKSKKFKRQLQSVAVDGMDILAAARDAGQKALAKLEAREAAAKAAAKREEERVTGLKKVRGERWLPSMAKNRHMGFQGR
ncbi:uncharacterized protein [Coffea arabica]|uniref:Uncharacterized protein n=1 Tax=Coffea arabica TaxID=13443 RepID=A0A6P6SY03_COFAR